MSVERYKELGKPYKLTYYKVSLPDEKRGRLMAYRDSDQLIVLYTIEEGADRIRSLQRITFAGQVGLDNKCKPHCRK
jgi:hypothetical protein